jgi:hypothetical protein
MLHLSLLLPLSLPVLQPLSVRVNGHGRVREHEEHAGGPPHPDEHQHAQRPLVRALQYIQRKAEVSQNW